MSYLSWAQAKVDEYSRLWPGIELKTNEELLSWLTESVPVLVHSRMVCSRAVKVCSTISPLFARLSLQRGFAVWTSQSPGHVFNVALTDRSPVMIDLSAAQFQVNDIAKRFMDQDERDDVDDEFDPYGIERATKVLLERVAADPFKAIRVGTFKPGKFPLIELSPSVLDDPFPFDYERARKRLGR